MAVDRGQQFGNAFVARRARRDHRRTPRGAAAVPNFAVSICVSPSASMFFKVGDRPVASGRSHLLTTWMSAISRMPALIAWMSSPEPRRRHDDGRVRGARDVDFVLTHADRLDDTTS